MWVARGSGSGVWGFSCFQFCQTVPEMRSCLQNRSRYDGKTSRKTRARKEMAVCAYTCIGNNADEGPGRQGLIELFCRGSLEEIRSQIR